MKELQRIVSQLELPESVARTASLIYRRALRLDLVRGRSIDSMIAASVYLACRQSAIPLTLKDILVSTPNVSAKDLGRCVRITIRYMNLHIKSSDFTAYVHRLGESLRMNMQSRELAVKILDRAKSEGLTMGINPMSIAAAALYIAGVQLGERRTQLDMAEVAKTTPVTIRNRFKELTQILEMEPIRIKRGPQNVQFGL